MVVSPDFFHEVATGFEHVVEELQFEVGEVSILAVFVFLTEVVLVIAPAAEGFERDAEAISDEMEVAVVLIEQVEGFDFGIKRVLG